MLAFNIRLKNMQSYYRICSINLFPSHVKVVYFSFFFSELLTAKSKTSTKDRQYKLLAGELKYNTIFLLFYSTRLLQRFFHTAKVLLPMHQLFTGRSLFRFICQELVISIIHPCTALMVDNFWLSGVYKHTFSEVVCRSL